MSYHTLIIVGRLGRDPELRYTPNGQAVCSLSIAADRSYTGKDGQQVKQTTWFRVSVWGKQAESANTYLQKGRMVLVEGTLNPDENGNPRTFSRQDGSTGTSYEVNASTVRFLGGEAGGKAGQSNATPDFTDDDFVDF